MACRVMPFSMTLSDFQGHSHVAGLLNSDISYSYAAVDKISTDIACLAVPLRFFVVSVVCRSVFCVDCAYMPRVPIETCPQVKLKSISVGLLHNSTETYIVATICTN